MRKRIKLLPLFPALCLLLGACGSQTQTAATEPPQESVPVYDVPGEDAADAGGEQENLQVVTDGLDGSYYNDYLRMTLVLDGAGGCTLTGGGADALGGYKRGEDGALALDFGARQETAAVDADGDITIEGLSGYFLRDWTFWGITADEAAAAVPEKAAQTGVVDNGDGTLRFRDLENGVAFTYADGMAVLRDEIVGGVAVRSGAEGCVTGRNVTELYFTHSGTDDEFLEDYVKTFVFADFTQLYGTLANYDGFTLLHEGVEGRLAAAAVMLKSADAEDFLQAKAILYTSTYPDGTVNYICKTVFAPPDALAALEAAVTDMGAVRLKEE